MDSTIEPVRRTQERIHRRRRVVFGELPEREREAIVDETFEIWSEHVVGNTRAEFREHRLFDDTRLHLFYGVSGELAAFLNFTVDPIPVSGRRLLVVSCAVMSRLHYRAMVPLATALTQEILRTRLTFARHELAYNAVASSPISFGTLTRFTPEYYPHVDGRVAPAYILDALTEVAHRRDLVIDDHDPWILRSDAVIRHPDRIRASRTMQNPDRFIRWFLDRAPNWDTGELLMMWIPLTFGNVCAGLMNLVRRRPIG